MFTVQMGQTYSSVYVLSVRPARHPVLIRREATMPLDEKRFPELIRELYAVVRQLEEMFPGRPFTPDGHMVGSLAECLGSIITASISTHAQIRGMTPM
jgi:hypothetical protein